MPGGGTPASSSSQRSARRGPAAGRTSAPGRGCVDQERVAGAGDGRRAGHRAPPARRGGVDTTVRTPCHHRDGGTTTRAPGFTAGALPASPLGSLQCRTKPQVSATTEVGPHEAPLRHVGRATPQSPISRFCRAHTPIADRLHAPPPDQPVDAFVTARPARDPAPSPIRAQPVGRHVVGRPARARRRTAPPCRPSAATSSSASVLAVAAGAAILAYTSRCGAAPTERTNTSGDRRHPRDPGRHEGGRRPGEGLARTAAGAPGRGGRRRAHDIDVVTGQDRHPGRSTRGDQLTTFPGRQPRSRRRRPAR